MSPIQKQKADSPEEVLDIVDSEDTVIGSMTRKKIYAQGLNNYRVVHAFIKRSDGKLWIPKRVDSKKLYPSALDFSVAGHVESGETYDEALHKEAREEVNIDLKNTPYQEIGYFTPYNSEVKVFQRIYQIEIEGEPNYNPGDFQSAQWLTPQEVIDLAQQGVSIKSDIPLIVKYCYLA